MKHLRLFVLMVFMLAVKIVFGQDGCKYKIDKTDQFTGEKIKQTYFKEIGYENKGWNTLKVAFKKKISDNDVKTYLVVRIFNKNRIDINFREGQKLMFKLANDKIITLNGLKHNESKKISGLIKEKWYCENLYKIDRGELNNLAGIDTKRIRIYYVKDKKEIQRDYFDKDKGLGRELYEDTLRKFSKCFIEDLKML